MFIPDDGVIFNNNSSIQNNSSIKFSNVFWFVIMLFSNI